MSIDQCPVCDGRAVRTFLTRSGVPVHQNLVIGDREAAVATPRGDLQMQVCESCGFVFNHAFDPALLAYGVDYDNTQSCSAVFDVYLDELVRHLVEEQGVRNCRVVEVGCGKGAFLRRIVEYAGSGNIGTGFDPSYVGPDRDLDGRLTFRRELYDAQSAALKADVVLCRHVIEHVPRPLQLLAAVRSALAEQPAARVYFETPCVEWILRNGVIWDFFYEHCSLFTASSLTTAFDRAGFRVSSVSHVFGGQYLWLEATPSQAPGATSSQTSAATQAAGAARGQAPIKPEPHGGLLALAEEFGAGEQRKRRAWPPRLAELREAGKVGVWGAGAKGATFVNLMDPAATLIDCVVDLNPHKQGHFIPGTGHPIVAYLELAARGVRNVILMNPNYRDENLSLLRQADIRANLIDWD